MQERGLGPKVATGSRGGAPPFGGLGSGRPQGGGGRKEGKGNGVGSGVIFAGLYITTVLSYSDSCLY